MNSLRVWMRVHKTFVLSIGFLVAFSVSVSYAVPPTSPYTAGETLDPQCAPGSSNCTVTAGGSSPWTVTGNDVYYTAGDAFVHGVRIGVGAGNVATNTAVGVSTLSGNTTGDMNVAIGYQVLSVNGAGVQNTAIGYQSMMSSTGSYNTAIGKWALLTNTTGQQNTAIGLNAMRFNTTGFQNVGMGVNTLSANIGGSQNTAMGNSALAHNTSGQRNTAVGLSAIFNNTTGSYNIGVGINALYNTTTGSYNIAIGNAVDVPSASDSGQLNIGNVLYGTGMYQNGITTSSTPTANGRIGIGTSNLIAALTVGGDGAIVATGTFGSGIAVPDLGAGTRMMWIPSKAAFRAGSPNGVSWDNASVGNSSTAFGNATTASGTASFAAGESTIASGNYSTAFGLSNTASGNQSTAFGTTTLAFGVKSTAFGVSANAQGLQSIAFGVNTTASGVSSIAFGDTTNAVGDNSTAFGYLTTASGNGSTASGYFTTASGNVSTTFGASTTATGEYSTAFGVQTTASNSYATAFGAGTQATGNTATAFGANTTASGAYSTAFGNGSTASGDNSTAFGSAFALGDLSIAFGDGSIASGMYSTAFGSGTAADSGYSLAVGRYNVGGGTGNNWIATDSLFEIGNGTDGSNRANALTVLKNGYLGLNTATPRAALDIAGDGAIIAVGEANSGITVPDLGAGTRMMWIPSKGVFRAGTTNGTEWDDANAGQFSTAFGLGNTASGQSSSVFGESSTASGPYSFVAGNTSIASAIGAVAIGTQLNALGDYATVFGLQNTISALAQVSTAFGSNNTIADYSNYSTVFGTGNTVSGNSATAFGVATTASGDNSTAFGGGTTASGLGSTAFGNNTTADSYGSTVFGQNNIISGGNAGSWIDTDSLFEVGNGIDAGQRSNALTLLKNGHLGLNTATPRAALDIAGDGAIIAVGIEGAGIAVPDLGAGTRMMWIPSKASFRAGEANADEWDDANVGSHSAAFGRYTKASGFASIVSGNFSTATGDTSTAFGFSTFAVGDISTAFGDSSRALGNTSTAFGGNTLALGNSSTAFGATTTASGDYSTAFGKNTLADSYNSTAFGAYNIGGGDPDVWQATDSLFEIGNGYYDDDNSVEVRSNALTILKNGNVGIKTATPTYLFTVGDGTVADGIIGHFETASGTCDIDPSSIGGVMCTSDMNAKKNITILADNSPWSFNTSITTDNSSIFAKLIALTPVQYNFNAESDTDIKHTGFIAQEVQQLFPDLVQTGKDGKKTMNYVGLVPYTIQAIKEMNLNITDIGNLDRPNNWRTSLIAWFGNANNGITNFFSKQVTTPTLCVGTNENKTCITKDQLDALLQNANNGGGSTTVITSSPSHTSDPAGTDDSGDTPKEEVKEDDTTPPAEEVQSETPKQETETAVVPEVPVSQPETPAADPVE